MQLTSGNPRRFESRDVLRMPQETLRNKKRKLDGQEHIETQSEKHLQTLLQRQIKKDITFTDHFSKHRTFTPATSHDPGIEKLVGLYDFEHYKQVGDLDSKIDYLRHCGLNDEEVTIWLQAEMKVEAPTGYGAHPMSKSIQLIEIQRKIQEKEKSLSVPDKFQGALELSRQERDLEESLAQKFGKISDLPSIITQKTFEETHPDDPINHIPEILNEVEKKKVERESRRDRRRRRKLERKNMYYDSLKSNAEVTAGGSLVDVILPGETIGDLGDGMLPGETIKESYLIDTECVINEVDAKTVQHVNKRINQSEKSHEVLIHSNETTNKSDNSYKVSTQSHETVSMSESTCEGLTTTGTSGQLEKMSRIADTVPEALSSLKEISGPIQSISKDEMEKNRLTLDEIKAMEKFQNYSIGEPNKIVYVKNLHPKVTDEELVALFACFQTPDKPRIVFKRLSGKMKGQAFITFPDETTAGEAIHLVNGYKLRDKPVILCYGRKQNQKV